MEAPHITVMTFQAKDTTDGLGSKVADMLRDRISDAFSQKDLFTVPTKDVINILEQSGFSVNDALPPYEEKALANLVRADEYVTGSVDQLASGEYVVSASLVLAHDNTLVQPLPTMRDQKLDHVLDRVTDALREALKQLPDERACEGQYVARSYTAAITAGRAGITKYPAATLARVCILTAQYTLYTKATTTADSARLADSALVTVRQILGLDSLNVKTLRMASDLFNVRGDSAHARQALLSLVRADPTNAELISQVVNELAATGHSQDAVPLVKDLLDKNPGDPQTLRTAFLVFLNAQDYEDAVATGPELLRVDSTAGDTTYYIRMAAAYQSLKQPQRQAEIFAAATAKYPDNADLWSLYAQSLREAGQMQQYVDALKHAVALNPNSRRHFQLSNYYYEQKMSDSLYDVLDKSVTAVTDTSLRTLLGSVALRQSNVFLNAAKVSNDSAGLVTTQKWAQLAERLHESPQASYTMGVSLLLQAQNYITASDKGKNCALVRKGKDALSNAQSNLAEASSDQQLRPALAQLPLQQLGLALDSRVKAYCK